MLNEETRKDFMQSIYDMFSDDGTNDRANQIIDMFDIATDNCIELPCKVKDLIDKVIGHNEIVAIWERRKGKEGRYSVLLWRGMAWEIPDEYLARTFLKIFGTVPYSITEADTVNIAVTPILYSVEEANRL